VERHLALHGLDAVEEVGRVEVVGNVGGPEGEAAGRVGHLSLLARKLRVLDDSVAVTALGKDTDRLGGDVLADDLGAARGVALNAAANEHGVGDADEAVVDAVAVDVLDAAGVEVREDGGRVAGLEGAAEGSVETAVSVRRNREARLGAEEELAVVGESGEDTWELAMHVG